MDTMTFCVPCLFGLEGLVGDELRRLDLQNVRVEDRRVFFEGDFAAMAKANLCCRMGERVMILLAEFDAHSFEDLFQGVKAVPLERFIPKNGAFPVKGYSLNSQLHSVPDCQAIVKKAAVTRLGEKYGILEAAQKFKKEEEVPMSQAVIGWLIAIVVFIVAEAATVALVSVWFIGGAVCALVAAILGAGLGVQLAVFLVVSAALLAFACPAARKKGAKKPERMNADRLVDRKRGV